RVKNGYWMKKASAVRQLEQNRLPILFIHGGDDSFVPVAMLDEVYKATAAPKERLVVPGAGHGAAGVEDPALYWKTIAAFFDRHMPPGRGRKGV
ncbi:MAG: alpha/beta hydrolase, partial [Oscillospiraceae bacterium]